MDGLAARGQVCVSYVRNTVLEQLGYAGSAGGRKQEPQLRQLKPHEINDRSKPQYGDVKMDLAKPVPARMGVLSEDIAAAAAKKSAAGMGSVAADRSMPLLEVQCYKKVTDKNPIGHHNAAPLMEAIRNACSPRPHGALLADVARGPRKLKSVQTADKSAPAIAGMQVDYHKTQTRLTHRTPVHIAHLTDDIAATDVDGLKSNNKIVDRSAPALEGGCYKSVTAPGGVGHHNMAPLLEDIITAGTHFTHMAAIAEGDVDDLKSVKIVDKSAPAIAGLKVDLSKKQLHIAHLTDDITATDMDGLKSNKIVDRSAPALEAGCYKSVAVPEGAGHHNKAPLLASIHTAEAPRPNGALLDKIESKDVDDLKSGKIVDKSAPAIAGLKVNLSKKQLHITHITDGIAAAGSKRQATSADMSQCADRSAPMLEGGCYRHLASGRGLGHHNTVELLCAIEKPHAPPPHSAHLAAIAHGTGTPLDAAETVDKSAPAIAGLKVDLSKKQVHIAHLTDDIATTDMDGLKSNKIVDRSAPALEAGCYKSVTVPEGAGHHNKAPLLASIHTAEAPRPNGALLANVKRSAALKSVGNTMDRSAPAIAGLKVDLSKKPVHIAHLTDDIATTDMDGLRSNKIVDRSAPALEAGCYKSVTAPEGRRC